MAKKNTEKKPEKKNTQKAAQAPATGIAAKIRPLGDRVVIREDESAEEKKTPSGFIIPASAQEDKGGKRGEVVAVGPGRTTEDGKTVAPTVKIGDTVMFQWGEKVRIGEDDYYIVRETEILAIMK